MFVFCKIQYVVVIYYKKIRLMILFETMVMVILMKVLIMHVDGDVGECSDGVGGD